VDDCIVSINGVAKIECFLRHTVKPLFMEICTPHLASGYSRSVDIFMSLHVTQNCDFG